MTAEAKVGPTTPIEHRSTVGSGAEAVELAWFEWPATAARRDDPAILLVHATGFHARCWDRVVPHLDGHRVLAIDVRGHGRSGKVPPFSWDRFAADLTDFVRGQELSGAIGVGHSMGGHSMTAAAAALPDAFSRLVLIDPVIMAPEVYAARDEWPEGELHPTAKRRDHWVNWQEMFARFEDRMPFAAWDRGVLEDYCRHGVLPDPDGDGWVLACPPRIEASIYMGSSERDIHEQVEQVQLPVTVVRAKERAPDQEGMDFSTSPTWPRLASRFPAGRDVHLPDHSHFIPMEDPALAAELILDRKLILDRR